MTPSVTNIKLKKVITINIIHAIDKSIVLRSSPVSIHAL